MNKLYKFEVNYGRHGSIEGIFIADDDLLEKIISKRIYLGDCCGKHSGRFVKKN